MVQVSMFSDVGNTAGHGFSLLRLFNNMNDKDNSNYYFDLTKDGIFQNAFGKTVQRNISFAIQNFECKVQGNIYFQMRDSATKTMKAKS